MTTHELTTSQPGVATGRTSPPKSVQQALAAVMKQLPAIGRDQQAAQGQGGYSYRGIESITKHVQPLLAQQGVLIIPQVQSMEVKDITVANRPWTDTTLVVNYLIVGPDGSSLTATTVGIGRDNSDKGANKAMTQAFKYLLLQLLCVSDAKDDVDGVAHEADRPQEPEVAWAEQVRTLQTAMRKLPRTLQVQLSEWADGRSLSGHSMIEDEAWMEQVWNKLDDLLTAHEADQTPQPQQTELMQKGRAAMEAVLAKQAAADQAEADQEES